MPVRQIARRLLGDRVVGMLDYYRFPHLRSSWGGPLNGQRERQRMVEAILRRMSLHAIVETGTYRGTTTAYLASLTGLPVYTVELDARSQGFAAMALWGFKNVRSFRGESRRFLSRLAESSLRNKPVFFYLDAHWLADAHWRDDLPLAEEIDIIFRNWSRALVLVDDFQVPDDPGYTYDDYGPGKALTVDYLRPAIRRFGLHTFFPGVSSARETAKKRGCVALAADADTITTLRTIPEVRELIVDTAVTSYPSPVAIKRVLVAPADEPTESAEPVHVPAAHAHALTPRARLLW